MNVVLALVLPTAEYLVVSRVAGWAITLSAAAICLWYVKRGRARNRGRKEPGPTQV